MFLRIIFISFSLLSHLSFNFFLLSSSHGSNPSSYHHHRLPSRPCCCIVLHSFSFACRTEHVLKHPSKLKFMKLSFQRAIMRILLRRCNLFKADFRPHNAQCLRHIFFYGSPKFSWCVGKKIWRSFLILTFLPL
jgi:hypothetical protein